MALEINAWYVKFVQFAQQQDDAVNSKVIARVSGEDGALDGRTITAATNDKVAPWTRRSHGKKDANNIARELFRQSIIDMFGGEDRIPESVKDAMLMKDYGRPGRTTEDLAGLRANRSPRAASWRSRPPWTSSSAACPPRSSRRS